MLGGGNVPGGASPGGGSLFERLEQAAGTEPDAGGHVIESIKRHLVRLLNAHPGNSASAPDLGLLDFNDATLGTHDLKLQIRGAIRRCIETFEPGQWWSGRRRLRHSDTP